MGGQRKSQDHGQQTQNNKPLQNHYPSHRCTAPRLRGGAGAEQLRFYIELSVSVNGLFDARMPKQTLRATVRENFPRQQPA